MTAKTSKRIVVHALVRQLGDGLRESACGNDTINGTTLSFNLNGEQVTCKSCLTVLNNATAVDYHIWSMQMAKAEQSSLALIYAAQHVKAAGRDVDRLMARLAGAMAEFEKAKAGLRELDPKAAAPAGRPFAVFPPRPLTVHGFPVLKALGIPGGAGGRDGWLILVRRGENDHVTAMRYEQDSEWHDGHYISDINAALDDFAERARRTANLNR